MAEEKKRDDNQAPDLFDMAVAAAEKEAVGNGDVVTTDELADIFLAGVGLDDGYLDPNDPDFWEKHDKQHHHGHFDPETQTCSLREEAKEQQSIEKLKDKSDDIGNAGPDETGIPDDARKEALEEAKKDEADDIGAAQPEVQEKEETERVEIPDLFDAAVSEMKEKGDKEAPEKSIEEIDAEYMEAVERGDMEKCAEMVREAAGRHGFETFGLHGTKNDFTSFDKSRIGNSNDDGWLGRGFYFWDKSNRTYAEQYANGGKVMEVMLSMQSPYFLSTAEQEKLIEAAEKHDIATLQEFTDSLKSDGYDSVVDENGQMMVFESAQIKSADPITYYDDGSVVPLSKRFGDGNDIRFSGESPSRENMTIPDLYESAMAEVEAEPTKEDVDADKGKDMRISGVSSGRREETADLTEDKMSAIIQAAMKARKDFENGQDPDIHQRVPEEALRGSDEGTRTLAEASLICRATEGAGGQGQGDNERSDSAGERGSPFGLRPVGSTREASRIQERLIEAYAKGKGIWEDDVDVKMKETPEFPEYTEGGETMVFFPSDSGAPVTKLITSSYFPETAQLLDRIALHNYLFPDTPLQVKGFGRTHADWGDDETKPMFCVKVAQEPIDTSRPASEQQIAEHMQGLGFEEHKKLANGDVVWVSKDGRFVVSDLTDENVFLDRDGNVRVVDANIQLNTPGSDGSGQYVLPDVGTILAANDKTIPDLFDTAIKSIDAESPITTDELADIFLSGVFAEDAEVDMAKHLKRYHKHGLTENSHCKYVDKINKEKDSTEPEDVDYATVKKKLWEDFGVETVRAKSIQDLEAIDFAPVDRGCFASQGKPISDEAHEVAIKKFYKTCVDLKQRFPDFQLPMPLLVPWDFSKCSAIGRSTTDRRISLLDKATYKLLNISDDKAITRECYIALGDLRILDGYTPNYEGAGSDFAETIIRHEIGHLLATKDVLEKWLAYKNNQFAIFVAKGREQAPILLKKFVVSSISEGAAENDEEAIAELFSIYSNPAYKNGHLPKEVEDIADFMLTQHKGKNMEELTTFDSRPEREGNVISGLPEWALRAMNYSTPMNPLYKGKPSQTDLAWWDQWEGKWHEFKTYDEMLCYVLNAYGFEKEHIEKISAALPKVKWTSMLLWEMREIYRHNDESVEEIIGRFSNETAAAEDAFPDLFEEAVAAMDAESPVTTDELADIFLSGVFAEDAEVDIAKHIKRYHKHGLTENSHCKYIDKVKEEKGESIQEPNIKQIKDWFAENFNIDIVHATTEDDLEYMGLSNDRIAKMKEGAPLTRKQFENTITRFYQTCKDLKDRFPKIKFGFDSIYPYDIRKLNAGGISSLDRRQGYGYVIIGDVETTLASMKIKDANIYDFILRHEIGHACSTWKVTKTFDRFFNEKFVEKYGKENLMQMLKMFGEEISELLKFPKDENWERAKEEMIADIFAFYTAPWYAKGFFPPEMEDFLNMMIENNEMPPQNEILAMDEERKAQEEILGTPYYVEGAEEITALHNPPTDSNRPYALNYIENKWEFFDTVEERDEFVKNLKNDPRISSLDYAKKWISQQLPKMKAYWRKRKEEKRQEKEDNIETSKKETSSTCEPLKFVPHFARLMAEHGDKIFDIMENLKWKTSSTAEDELPDLFDEAVKAADKTVKGDTRMSENNIAEQGVLTESVIVDSGIIDMTPKVHPVTTDELADIFLQGTIAEVSDERKSTMPEDAAFIAEDTVSDPTLKGWACG